MNERGKRVEQCIEDARSIREQVQQLCKEQEEAIAICYGVYSDSSSEDEVQLTDGSHSLSDYSSDTDTNTPSELLCDEQLLALVVNSSYNWFELVLRLEEVIVIDHQLLYSQIQNFQTKVSSKNWEILMQLWDAFIHVQQFEEPLQERNVRSWNGEVVSESDSDNPDEYTAANKQVLIQNKVQQIRRRAKRAKAKKLAAQNFLGRRKTAKPTIVDKFPDVGKVIEKFVEERSVGADAWRRTGVHTFDGNIAAEQLQKVTYQRIRDYLAEHYKQNISYGTVVQICVAHNLPGTEV